MKAEIVDLIVNCKCGNQWIEEKSASVFLPFEKHVKCQKCKEEFNYKWLHPEARQKLEEKKLGLLPESIDKARLEIVDKRMDAIEAKLIAITTEQELLRTKLDLLTKDEIQKIKEEASDHNFHLNSLHDRMNKVEEKFDKINAWQSKQNNQQSTSMEE